MTPVSHWIPHSQCEIKVMVTPLLSRTNTLEPRSSQFVGSNVTVPAVTPLPVSETVSGSSKTLLYAPELALQHVPAHLNMSPFGGPYNSSNVGSSTRLAVGSDVSTCRTSANLDSFQRRRRVRSLASILLIYLIRPRRCQISPHGSLPIPPWVPLVREWFA